MKQDRRSTGWNRLWGSVLLGAWLAACGPAPQDEAGPAEKPVAEERAELSRHEPLPPSAPLARGGPAVAYGNSRFLVVWSDVREGGIYGARLKADGTLLDPEGIRINTSDTGGSTPAVAFDGRNFVVVFEDRDGIAGVRVRPDGTVLGPLFRVISSDEVDEPAIACAPWKVCLVTYTVEGDFDSAIGFRLVRPDGTVFSPPPDSSFGTRDVFATDSSVAWNNKEFLVVWTDTRGGLDTPDIYGGRVRPDGTRVSAKGGFPISEEPGAQSSADVTWTGRRFLTVWEDTRPGEPGIFGARVRKDETVDDPDGIRISPVPGFLDVDPAVAHHNSKSLVVWRRGDAIYGARVHENGDVMDPAGFIIALESDEQLLPDVAYGSNRFLTAYGHGGTSEPPFPIAGKVVRHDTRVGSRIDITRTSEPLP